MKRGSIVPNQMLLPNIITSQLADTDLGPAEKSSETGKVLYLHILKRKKQSHNKHIWLVVEPTHLKNLLVKMGASSPSN